MLNRGRGALVILVATVTCCSPSNRVAEASAPLLDVAKDSIAGLEVIRSSDCITCHSQDRRLIGPSFTDIRRRYQPVPQTLSILSAKIINGGSGSWGDLPMTPHRDMTKEKAELAVKYILSLKN